MKYLSQFLIILGFTLAGEALQRLIPVNIPGSVYGLVLLFASLCLGIVKLEQVQETGKFLITLMPVLFVAPAAGILENWGLIQPRLLGILLITVAATVLTFGISGGITRFLIRKGGTGND
jgi:holin-like protein